LAAELQANAEAFVVLREEVMPLVAVPSRPASPWRWAVAVAAMLVAGIGLWRAAGPARTPTSTIAIRTAAMDPPKAEPAMPVIAQARLGSPSHKPVARRSSWRLVGFNETTDEDGSPITEALMRKVTRDPDVVIYWLIDPRKEEPE
jgi:hypothetical protein